jgi:hypothetical protein
MRGSRPVVYRITAATLFLMLGGFIVLSGDVILRVWLLRHGLGSAVDAAVLLAYEAARALTTALALALAVASYRWAGDTGRRAFTLLLLFLALWYTKAFAFASFPGYLQERMALWLFAHGVPRGAAAFLFGMPVWAAWLALGALLRVSAEFPQPLEAAVIERSGQRDRAGMMRGVSIAGADVGALARRGSAALLQFGALRPAPVWLLAASAGTIHALAPAPALRAALSVPFGLLVMVALTNLRAAAISASAGDRRRTLWLAQAAIAAAAAFGTTAVLSGAASAVTEGLSLLLAALSPPVVLMGMAFVMKSHPPDPRPAIANTLLAGVAALALAAAFVLTSGVAAALVEPPVPIAAAAAAAPLCCALLWSRIRRLAGRLAAAVAAAS